MYLRVSVTPRGFPSESNDDVQTQKFCYFFGLVPPSPTCFSICQAILQHVYRERVCSSVTFTAVTTATDLIMFCRVRTGGRITESVPTSNLSSTSSSAPLATLASVMAGSGPGTHIATSHDDTSEGAVHCFRDEHGNWQSYTFAEKGTGTANVGMMPIAAAAAATAATANGKLLSTLLRYCNPMFVYMSLSCTLICCLASMCNTLLEFYVFVIFFDMQFTVKLYLRVFVVFFNV